MHLVPRVVCVERLPHGCTSTGIATTRSEPSDEELNARIRVCPAARPVMIPLESTVATDSSSESQRAEEPTTADSDVLAPAATRTGTATVSVVLPTGVALDVEVVPVVPDPSELPGVPDPAGTSTLALTVVPVAIPMVPISSLGVTR